MAKSKNDLILDVINEIISEGNSKVHKAFGARCEKTLRDTMSRTPVANLVKRLADNQKEIEFLQEEIAKIQRDSHLTREGLQKKHNLTSERRYGNSHYVIDGFSLSTYPESLTNRRDEQLAKLNTIRQEAVLAIASARAPELALIAAAARKAVEDLDV